jgi:phenylalanyl-tRNA synthetase beta chain
MLLVGQPLHAFDLDKVRGERIIVRKAQEGEKMVTLDGTERTFDSSMALVCDAEGPSGIAGIMGGQISEVSDGTTRELMEAATWVGINISRTSAKLALRSEASARFEKQLHPELGAAAQRLAARLMVELCGATQVGAVDVYPEPAEARVLALRPARVEKLLGELVPEQTEREILARLGFEVDESWSVPVPYWRDSDVQREVDLIEEIARIHGLQKLPTTLPERSQAVGALTHSQRARRRAEDALRDRGALEAIAYSFTREQALADLRLGDVPVLRVANPLSEEHRVMRPLLLPGLLDAARHNTAHGRPALTLFESAHVYRMSGDLHAPGPQAGGDETSAPADERHHLGVVSTAKPDFLATKALLEALLASLGVEGWTEPGERPFLHPGRSASVLAGDDNKVGWIGELHPAVARAWDLGRAAAFEVDADALAALSPEAEQYRAFPPFPAVTQDIAVVVDEEVPYAEVETLVREGGGELLESVELFDLYRGEQAGEGKKSLALRLAFRAPDRTLTDEDVAALRGAIEERLAEVGGRLRAG